MTVEEALKLATEHFNRTWGQNPGWNSFTGEVRVINGADAAAAIEREIGNTFEPSQRGRVERYYRVVFVSALPQADFGNFDVVVRVNKVTGETVEEVCD